MKFDLAIKTFRTPKDFEKWLAKNYHKPEGIWLKFYKKASGIKSIVYADALDVALCYGWIDGQVRSYDAKSYLQRFTPRRKRSAWSRRNVQHIARLTKLGKMQPSGLAAVNEAKKSGLWDVAYHSQKTMTIPKEFLRELAKNKKAKEFYDTLTKSTLYTIYYRVTTPKREETRKAWTKKIISMLVKKQKPSFF